MLKRLKQFLTDAETPPPEDPEELVRLATCVILLEVAHADDEFSEVEQDLLLATLRGRFQLDRDESTALINAADEARAGKVDLWQFTHTLNEHCSVAEKIQILEEVWRVICADGMLDAHEDHLVHRLAKLFNLTHEDLITAKVKVLNENRSA